MTHRSPLIYFAALASACLLLGAPVRAGTDFVTWVLIDGPFAGVQLNATSDAPDVISADFNPATGAEGSIASGSECPGPHYHGLLFGGQDDGTGCGWGQVALIGSLSEGARDVSDAMYWELIALGALNAKTPDIDSAIEVLESAKMFLREVVQDIRADPRKDFTRGERGQARAAVERARNLDRMAQNMLRRIARRPPPPERLQQRLQRIRMKLFDALDEKQEALLLFPEFDKGD